VRRPVIRYSALLVVNFLTIYSGYGFFMGLVTPALLLVDVLIALRANQKRNLVPSASAFVLALVSLASFFVGYPFAPAAPCYRFPLHPLYSYPWFMALMLANPFRLKGHGPLATIVGVALLALAVQILVRRLRDLWNGNSPQPGLARVSAVLLGFTLLYAGGAAIGRLCFGLDYAQESRYVVFVNLALLAFYLEALALKSAVAQKRVLAALFVGLLAGNFYPSHRDRAQMQYFSETKSAWKQCYLQYEDISRCDRQAGGVAYPRPEQTQMQQKLEYMKAHRLNLFSGQD
jgi:hypothetical protein